MSSVDQALAEQAKPFTERGEHDGPARRAAGRHRRFAAGQGAPPPRFGEPAGNVQIVAPGGR